MNNNDKTPRTPKPNGTVADLKVGDRFVWWRYTYAMDFSTGRRIDNVVDRSEGIVLSIEEPTEFYWAITEADRSQPRLSLRIQHPTCAVRQEATGKRQPSREVCLLLDEAITIYR
jgi:hypothetical protein